MPEYSPSSTEAVLQLSDVLVLVFDTSTNKYTIKWYNSSTASWEEVVQYDGANKQFTILPTVIDNLELNFGTDNDFGVLYDSSSDTFVIKDNTNGTEVTIPKNQNRNLGQFSKYRNVAVTTGVSIGASGSPATIASMSVSNSDFMTLMPLTIKATPSGLGTSETATFSVVATLDDGSTVTLASKTTAAGSTATETFTPADYDFTLIGDGKRIVKLEVTAESSATSTSATATATIGAIEYD